MHSQSLPRPATRGDQNITSLISTDCSFPAPNPSAFVMNSGSSILSVSPAPAMISISNSVITGGRFTQHHTHDYRQIQVHGAKNGFDLLQEAVAPGAFHNSGERFDPPKCHPNTRVAVMKKVMDWITDQDIQTRDALIMWVNGAAGAGKSAIAQSIAELCYAEGRLIASFFFGRSDPNRNHAGPLFATIAYQMTLALPQTREKVVEVVEQDPLIFKRSLSTQFLSLIVGPLRHLSDSGFFNNPSSPRLVIIDGLDECLDREVQCAILDVVFNGIRQHHLPLIFLFASRPELDISAKFNAPELNNALTRLVLDDSYKPDTDITLYLRDKFKDITETHPFKSSIPLPWPMDDVIESLVHKSSGQFIYASTVIKYVKSNRHRPHYRLEVIRNLRPANRDLPFAELDALYTHIFSSIDQIDQVLHIISFYILPQSLPCPLSGVERLLSLDPGDIEVLFCDLGSIVALQVLPSYNPQNMSPDFLEFCILHASLPDFLLDQSRSKRFHIDISFKCTEHLRKCFQFLTYEPMNTSKYYGIWKGEVHHFAMNFIRNNCTRSLPSAELRSDLLSFSIGHLYKEAAGIDLTAFVRVFFIPPFFAFLRLANFEDAQSLYNHHLQAFDEDLRQPLEIYYTDKHLTLLVALVDFVCNHKHFDVETTELFRTLTPSFQVFDVATVDETDGPGLTLLNWLHHPREYYRLIHKFLEDSARSRQYALDGAKYATAALCCMMYLCDHCSAPQIMPPRYFRQERSVRRNAPWMWLKRIRYGALEKTRLWKKERVDQDYRDRKETVGTLITKDPRIAQYVWAKKYSYALEYFSYFLSRSGRSVELLELCRRCTFGPRSQEFPKLRKKARRAVTEYVERMDSGSE